MVARDSHIFEKPSRMEGDYKPGQVSKVKVSSLDALPTGSLVVTFWDYLIGF